MPNMLHFRDIYCILLPFSLYPPPSFSPFYSTLPLNPFPSPFAGASYRLMPCLSVVIFEALWLKIETYNHQRRCCPWNVGNAEHSIAMLGISTDYVMERCMSVCLSVCLSICLMHVGIVSKQLNISSSNFSHRQVTTPVLMFFHSKRYGNIPTWTPLTGPSKSRGCEKNRNFRQIYCFISEMIQDRANGTPV